MQIAWLPVLGKRAERRERCCYDNGVSSGQDSTQKGNLRTIFLDRDGVVNEKMPEGKYVRSWSELRILPGVPEAVARLNRAGLRVILVSNQRGIALGLYSAADVNDLHQRLQATLRERGAHLDAVYFCPHNENECDCRKPLPGMFQQARRDFPEIDAATSVMIGDSLSDIEFGQRLGMRAVFIDVGGARQKPGAERARQMARLHFSSLNEAVDFLLDSQ